jgi:signal transduction histidine kinase
MDMHAEITYVEDSQVEVFADYDLVKQLLWIHGENALKYSGENGKIQVHVWKDENYGYVSVEDNGVGIAEEDIPKVFDRFYRADKSRNKEIAGTGLGLAIAKWIMDSHDGEIIVKSRLGEGTAFINRFHLAVTEEKSGVK